MPSFPAAPSLVLTCCRRPPPRLTAPLPDRARPATGKRTGPASLQPRGRCSAFRVCRSAVHRGVTCTGDSHTGDCKDRYVTVTIFWKMAVMSCLTKSIIGVSDRLKMKTREEGPPFRCARKHQRGRPAATAPTLRGCGHFWGRTQRAAHLPNTSPAQVAGPDPPAWPGEQRRLSWRQVHPQTTRDYSVLCLRPIEKRYTFNDFPFSPIKKNKACSLNYPDQVIL